MPTHVHTELIEKISAATTQIPTAQDKLAQWHDAALLQVNLQAMKPRYPELVASVQQTEVPPGYEPAVALDGQVSYRHRDKNGHWAWLGGNCVPLLFAQSVQEQIELGSGNLALKGIGTGADVWCLLGRMASYQALLVIESDLSKLRMVLSLYDYSHWLETGQLALINNNDEQQGLRCFYERYPGYNLVQKTVALPYQDEKQNRQDAAGVNVMAELALQQILRQLDEAVHSQRTRASEWKRQTREAVQERSELRVSNVSSSYVPEDVILLRDMLDGMVQLGVQTERYVPDRPDSVSHSAQLKRMDRFMPHVILLKDQTRGQVDPELPEGTVCVSFFSGNADPDGIASKTAVQDIIVCEDDGQCRRWVEAGLTRSQVVSLEPCANEQVYHPLERSERNSIRLSCEVAIVSNRSSLVAEDYGIKLPTHQKLFAAVVKEIATKPHMYDESRAQQILEEAQRCGVTLQEKDLQAHYSRLIRGGLAKTVLVETYGFHLVRNGIDLKVWHPAGLSPEHNRLPGIWQPSELKNQVKGTLQDGPTLNRLFNTARIVVSLDGYRPNRFVLNGLAAGAFILIKADTQGLYRKAWEKILQPDEELIFFDTPTDFISKVQYYLSHEQERQAIADAGRRKIQAGHTACQRMDQLLEAIEQHVRQSGF